MAHPVKHREFDNSTEDQGGAIIMPIFNYKAKEMIVKVVYYGPGLCGKTTSLQYLHQQIVQERKGELYFLATETDQTIYFELLPLYVGEINRFKLRFQVYTVPGQVKYNNTRKAVLQGVDAIVFVADSQRSRREANIISFKNLQYNLKGGYNILLSSLPLVYEYNKRDMKDVLSIDDLNQDLNPWKLPYFETIAVTGEGVLDAFETISSSVIKNLEKRFQLGTALDEHSERPASPTFFQRSELQTTAQEEFTEEEGASWRGEQEQALPIEEEVTFTEEEKAVLSENEAEENDEDVLTTKNIEHQPLFPGKKHKELSYTDIVDQAYRDGDIIFEEGEPGNDMYFIEEGKVKIISSYRDTRKIVAVYEKGDFFGEMALLGGKTRSARAVAVGRTRLLPVTRDTLATQIPQKPEIAMALLETLSARISHNTKTISKLADQNKELMQHLQKARNVIQQMKEQNEFLRQKLDVSRK